MAAPTYSASDFASAIHALMPRGLVWPRDAASVQAQVIAGLAPAVSQHTLADNNLLVDAFPLTAVQLLSEWESTLGLPDPCAGESPTLLGRQQQVVARLTNSGGQSIPYFVAFAKSLGYTITVTEYAPFRAGQSRAGQPTGTQDWFFTWQINAPLNTVTYFTAGNATAGQALGSWGNAVLECELTTIKPAHTYLNFGYQ